jgi:hypothetical protein
LSWLAAVAVVMEMLAAGVAVVVVACLQLLGTL